MPKKKAAIRKAIPFAILILSVWIISLFLKDPFRSRSEKTYSLCVEQIAEQLEKPNSAPFQTYKEAIDDGSLQEYEWVGWVESENEAGENTKTSFNCKRVNNTLTMEF